MAAEEGAELFIPPLTLCTDNAAMAGIASLSSPPARRPTSEHWTSPPAWSEIFATEDTENAERKNKKFRIFD